MLYVADNDGSKDIYYIFEVSKKDATKKFRDVKILELKNISASVFMQMIPSEILGDAVVKTDEKKNLLVIIAGPESLAGIISFVNLIDVKNDKEKVKSTREIKLKYIKSQELIDSISEPVNRNSGIIICVNKKASVIKDNGNNVYIIVLFIRL